MKTSAQGRKLIIQREGSRTTAYRDSVGILTIGCGHTSMAGPPTVTAGMVITEQQVDEILSADLAKFEFTVNSSVTVPLADHEFDACVSLAYNIGQGAFKNSTVVRELNAGNRASAADAFLMWKNAGGRPILLGRREAEKEQFLTPYVAVQVFTSSGTFTGAGTTTLGDTLVIGGGGNAPQTPTQPASAAQVPIPPPDPRPVPTPSPQPASSGLFSALIGALAAIFRRN
jgi:lysozyme